MRVTVLTIFTNDFGVIELIVNQIVLGVLVSVDFDLGKGIVDIGQLITFGHSGV
jgi:hypothetical protein